MSVVAVIAFFLPIVLLFLLEKSNQIKLSVSIIGAGAYFVFAFLLSFLLKRAISGIFPSLDQAPAGYLAAIFVCDPLITTAGVALAAYFFRDKLRLTADSFGFAIGFAAVALWLQTAIPLTANVFSALSLNELSQVEFDLLNPEYAKTLTELALIPAYTYIVTLFSTLLLFAANAAVCVIVWLAVTRSRARWTLAAALLLRTLFSLIPALEAVGVEIHITVALIVTYAGYALAVASAVVIWKKYINYKPEMKKVKK
jgi:uncharacterized membrane protein YhfC